MINKTQFAIISALALSLALTLHALATDSFWGDEILTASFAAKSPAEVIHWTANDIHPPLYYLLAGTFAKFTGPLGADPFPSQTTDWLWRFSSVIATVLTVATTYHLTFYTLRVRFAHPPSHIPYPISPIALSAALLLALSPVVIKYSQEARMHALFMFLSALATLLLFRAMNRPRSWSRWLVFALATAANLYTMYFGFLILAAQAGFVVSSGVRGQGSEVRGAREQVAGEQVTRNTQHATRYSQFAIRNSPLIGFSAATLLAFILYLPWWPVLFTILRKRAAVGAIEGGVGNPLDFLSGVVYALGPTTGPAAWLFLLLFIVALVFLAKQYWPMAVLPALWLGLPTLLPIILGDPRALQFRYAFVMPVYLAVIAYGVARICAPAARRAFRPTYTYAIWILATISFIATLGIYQQEKPNWRDAAAYLTQHTQSADIILTGPLWDEGRFIGYYYRGQAQLLTPAAMVANIGGRVEGLRLGGGKIWAVNRFAPAKLPATENVLFSGVVVSEPQLAVYEAPLLTEAVINLAAQTVDAAYPWAIESEAQGTINPDPRTAKAGALKALGDTLLAAGRADEAISAYQTAVDIFPGWVSGFVALAEAHEANGNLPSAAAAYQQAVAFNLGWQGPEAEHAAALIETSNWPDAIKIYRLIIGN